MSLLVTGFVLLLLNSALLVGFPGASLWYYANVAAHPILGAALAAAFLPRIARLWRGGVATRAVLLLGFAGLLSGLALVWLGATRSQSIAVWVHVVTASVAAAAIG